MKKLPLDKISEPGLYMLKHRRMGWNYVGEVVEGGSFPWVDEDLLRCCDEAFGPLPDPDMLLAMAKVVEVARAQQVLADLVAETDKPCVRKGLSILYSGALASMAEALAALEALEAGVPLSESCEVYEVDLPGGRDGSE